MTIEFQNKYLKPKNKTYADICCIQEIAYDECEQQDVLCLCFQESQSRKVLSDN